MVLVKQQNEVDKGIKAFQCHECGKCFASKNNLKCHVDTVAYKKVGGNEDKKNIQKKVAKVFDGTSTSPLIFPGLNEKFEKHLWPTFEQERSLKRHKTTNHQSKFLRCLLCEKKFTYHYDLSRHKAEQHKIFECHVCGKEFSSDLNLNSHHYAYRDMFGNLFFNQCTISYQLIPCSEKSTL